MALCEELVVAAKIAEGMYSHLNMVYSGSIERGKPPNPKVAGAVEELKKQSIQAWQKIIEYCDEQLAIEPASPCMHDYKVEALFELGTLGEFLPCEVVNNEGEIREALERALLLCADDIGLRMSALKIAYNEALSKNKELELEATNRQLEQIISEMGLSEGVEIRNLEKIWSVSKVFFLEEPKGSLNVLAELNLKLFDYVRPADDTFATKMKRARWTGNVVSTLYQRSKTRSLALLNSMKRVLEVDLVYAKKAPDVLPGTKVINYRWAGKEPEPSYLYHHLVPPPSLLSALLTFICSWLII